MQCRLSRFLFYFCSALLLRYQTFWCFAVGSRFTAILRRLFLSAARKRCWKKRVWPSFRRLKVPGPYFSCFIDYPFCLDLGVRQPAFWMLSAAVISFCRAHFRICSLKLFRFFALSHRLNKCYLILAMQIWTKIRAFHLAERNSICWSQKVSRPISLREKLSLQPLHRLPVARYFSIFKNDISILLSIKCAFLKCDRADTDAEIKCFFWSIPLGNWVWAVHWYHSLHSID